MHHKNLIMKQNKTLKKTIIGFVSILFMVTGIMSCKSDDDSSGAKTKTFVLVHGAWQAAFVWKDVKEQLEKMGHQVVIVELQAHGQDQSALNEATLSNYTARIKDAVNKVDGKVILVGHSLGGVVITQTAAQLPSKIEKLVYIAGFIPQNGKSILDLANTDANSLLGAQLDFSADMSTAGIKDAAVNLPRIFCQDGTQEQNALLVKNLRPEPTAPLGTPVQYDMVSYKVLDKYYIYTTEDHAISYSLQQTMVKDAGITKTFSIASGHSPFVSKPSEVSTILLGLTK